MDAIRTGPPHEPHTLQDVLDRLLDARPSGSGYRARCPAHNDQEPSLSIDQKDGRILLHCFAGCTYEAIKDKLGLNGGARRTATRAALTLESLAAHKRLPIEFLQEPWKQRSPATAFSSFTPDLRSNQGR